MKKLIIYLPAGLKDKHFNEELIEAMVACGVDIIELGLPFSDPLADGEVIQKANLRSLQQGFKIDHAMVLAKEIEGVDFLLMGYFNTFYQKGFAYFTKHLGDKPGFKGYILPDMPLEESHRYERMIAPQTIIPFVAPTTDSNRLDKLLAHSSYFIYLVAYTGVTGKKSSADSDDLSPTIAYIKSHTNTPLYIGFGVTPDNAKEKVRGLDGVIVGSHIVKILLDDSLSHQEQMNNLLDDIKIIKEQIQ